MPQSAVNHIEQAYILEMPREQGKAQKELVIEKEIGYIVFQSWYGYSELFHEIRSFNIAVVWLEISWKGLSTS